MYIADYIKYSLKFLKPAGTSRGVLSEKESYFIFLRKAENLQTIGIGECSLIPGLSPDNPENIEEKLKSICSDITSGRVNPAIKTPGYPAIQFGLETALSDLQQGGKRILFPSAFTRGEKGIPINGLIWMGNKEQMHKQIEAKLSEGYSILKLKVGALNFSDELEVLHTIRSRYKEKDLEIRLDANGAWPSDEVMSKLKKLSEYYIHSIEQPIAPGQIVEMAKICANSPIPIALDEELIGIEETEEKKELLNTVQPSYVIIKPSLLGGFESSQEWIAIAEQSKTGWWITSALESNIGLNAIAQWTGTLETAMPQGLGTGSLFANNFSSPLTIKDGKIYYQEDESWDISILRLH